MGQWINLNRNNSFVNWTRLPSFSERSGAILQVCMHMYALFSGVTKPGPTRAWARASSLKMFLEIKIKFRYHMPGLLINCAQVAS